jgi:uncharacterized protein (DUF1778 family)
VERKLYVEYRVYFDPMTDQDLLHEQAKVVQDKLHDVWIGLGETALEDIEPVDVTYECVMEVWEKAKGAMKAGRLLGANVSKSEYDYVCHAAKLAHCSQQQFVKRAINAALQKMGVDAVLLKVKDAPFSAEK